MCVFYAFIVSCPLLHSLLLTTGAVYTGTGH